MRKETLADRLHELKANRDCKNTVIFDCLLYLSGDVVLTVMTQRRTTQTPTPLPLRRARSRRGPAGAPCVSGESSAHAWGGAPGPLVPARRSGLPALGAVGAPCAATACPPQRSWGSWTSLRFATSPGSTSGSWQRWAGGEAWLRGTDESGQKGRPAQLGPACGVPRGCSAERRGACSANGWETACVAGGSGRSTAGERERLLFSQFLLGSGAGVSRWEGRGHAVPLVALEAEWLLGLPA